MQETIYTEGRNNTAFSSASIEYPRDRKGKAFLKRVFHRRSVPEFTSDRKRRDSVLSNASTIYTMMPSPNTHPLLVKPIPREEFIAGNRGKTYKIRSHENTTTQPVVVVTLTTDFDATDLNTDVKPTSINAQKKTIGSIVKPKRERESMQDVTFFTRCYAEGRFNISNPPEPPQQIQDQNFFPAPTTPREEIRLEAVRSCKAAFGLKESSEKCHRLVDLANTVFQTPMGGISFIDDKIENFEVGGFLTRTNITRISSIGAHVLLSHEPMIVLNASKDWRFRGMQVVENSPGLHFYAGAPLVNSEGDVVGVFAVFDTSPREGFTMAHRRKLMDFAKLAMAEIDSALEEWEILRRNAQVKDGIAVQLLAAEMQEPQALAPEERRPSVTQEERDLVRGRLLQGIEEDAEKMKGDAAPHTDSANPSEKSKPAMVIPKVEIQPVETPDMETSEVELPKIEKTKPEKPKLEKPRVEKQAPMDRYPQPGKLKVRVRSGIPKVDPPCDCGFKNAHTAKNHAFAVRDLPSPPFTPNSNRPFSMISSISPTQRLQPPRPHSFASTTTTRTRSSSPLQFVNPFAYVNNGSNKASKRISHQISVGSGLKQSANSRIPVKNHTEAEFAISIIARSLGFDLVYLLRMGPIRSDIPEKELVGHGIYTQILVSHGMPKPEPVFDGSLHLRALRSHGGLIYSNPNQVHADEGCGYQLGILLPLHRDNDGLEVDSDGGILCRAGTVLCAYTRAIGRELHFAEEEVRLLRDFGEAMRDILLLADPDHGSGSEVAPHSQFRSRMASV